MFFLFAGLQQFRRTEQAANVIGAKGSSFGLNHRLQLTKLAQGAGAPRYSRDTRETRNTRRCPRAFNLGQCAEPRPSRGLLARPRSPGEMNASFPVFAPHM